MRRVVAYLLTSLDNAVDDPRRYFPESDPSTPSPPVFDDEMVRLESAMIATQDTVLLGRNTYDEWAG